MFLKIGAEGSGVMLTGCDVSGCTSGGKKKLRLQRFVSVIYKNLFIFNEFFSIIKIEKSPSTS